MTSTDDPLAAGKPVGADELEGRRWLLREPGSGTRLVNEEFLAGAGIAVETLTLGSNGAIKQAARAGLGVSFVSRDAVANELDAGLLGVIPVASGPGGPSVVRDALGRRAPRDPSSRSSWRSCATIHRSETMDCI